MALGRTEKEVALELGIPLRSLRSLRKKTLAAEDWHKPGREVLIFEHGINKLLAGLELKKKALAPSRSDGLGLEMEERTGHVAKIWHSKARILGVRVEGLEELCRVRVRTCQKFLLGMETPIRKIGPELWELARPLPRWRGRW